MAIAKQILIFITQTFCIFCFAQTKTIDSLKKILPSLKDTARIDCLNELGFEYSNQYWSKSKFLKPDTALIYTVQAQQESQIIHYTRGIGKSFQNFGMIEQLRGNFIKSEQYKTLAIPLLEKMRMPSDYKMTLLGLGWCSFNEGRYMQALNIYKEVLPYYKHIGDTMHIAMIYRMMGNAYVRYGYSDSAFQFFYKNAQIKKRTDDINGVVHTMEFKGDLYLVAGDTVKAVSFYAQGVDFAKARNVTGNHDYPSISLVYKLKHQYDSALYYFKQDIILFNQQAPIHFLRKEI